MSAFWVEWKRDLLNQRTAAMWGFATLIAAITGPMGSYENCTFDHRLMLWGMWIGLFALIGTGARAFVHQVLGLRDFHRGGLLTAVLVACGVGFPVNAMNVLSVLPVSDGPYLNAGLPEIAATAFVLTLAIVAHHHFWHGAPLSMAQPLGAEPVATAPAEAAEPFPRIVMRLEPALRGPLVALSVRDHYVDVQTVAGRGTLLMRLGDAVEEVEPVVGAQVHRSHWVAWDQVMAVDRSEAKVSLVMTAGPRIPVSRTNRDRLVERGLI
ncbi:MAG: LytTR family DNA-binding domain-containing protein [Rhodobacteraceae bacterium]|nr:LytTR family DNA-binding domain-containing protein [Paracoccaceae bacterium]